MEEKKRNHEIIMQTFGCFSLRYDDISLTADSRKSESQYHSLLQILLHYRKEGVEKSRLEMMLFGNKELNNASHTLQSVIYNTKKRLRESGLPETDYITLRNGIYFWCDEIPVREDAREFEGLYEEALRTDDLEKRKELLLSAMYLYQGSFLPNQNNVVWVSELSWKYKNMFQKIIGEISEIARKTKDYNLLERVGLYASSVDPFEDYEELIMESYVSLGKYEEARKLYLSTSDLYIKKQETLPSDKISDLLNSLSKQIEFPHNVMSDVQKRLEWEMEGEETGGYECTYPTFVGIYRSIYHIMERKGEPAYLMLCTIVDSKGNMMRNTPKLQEFSDRLGEEIRHNIRKSDIVNRYGMAQYLVLLTNTTLENCRKIQQRINKSFVVNRQRIRVHYAVADVFAKEDS